MRTAEVIGMMKQSDAVSESDKEWIDEHGSEYDDMAYEESVGRAQSWNDGSMLGSPNAYKGVL